MGIFDKLQKDFKEFVHSLTTDDHYASFDSPYANANSDRRPLTAALNSSNSNNALSTSLNGPVAYRPGLRSQLAHNGSDVQLQDYDSGEPPLPSMESIWDRLDRWFEEEYPELGDNLQEGASAADLNEFENDLRCSLPLDVRQSYTIHDGQVRGGQPTGAFMGLTFLDLEGIFEEARIWERVVAKIETLNLASHARASTSEDARAAKPKARQQIDFQANQTSVPEGHIQQVYAHAGWIPLAKDWAGNNVAVDLAPGPEGRWGQVILFGREFDRKIVVAKSWTEFLYHLVEDYEDGNYLVDDEDESLWYKFRGSPASYMDILTKRVVGIQKINNQTPTPKVETGVSLRQAATVASANSRVEVDLPKVSLLAETSKPLAGSLIDEPEQPKEESLAESLIDEPKVEKKEPLIEPLVDESKKDDVKEVKTEQVKTEQVKEPVVPSDDLDSLDEDLNETEAVSKKLEEVAL
ncbi:hypothetical protein BABINDRAFT_159323 [Babjeviella inositovora NRRL Y-12698]|uniref:Knr4/Smi1-like domain-containing protein n=1 Tax=Babjeviella inositovora NRRL Y-12698 TaxID=984486 RepID=A0A1E3R0C9_9ASCO|nr:uncharacterized protein BABINDRAFT_159323 [Babjeviella inositovora NRRL Y-12698]ODQ82822.1 hypothetical protein BABINDRAFT_159323 [Babjeviella inositovora NRRL Y-12698]